MSKQPKYINLLSNESAKSQGWMFASFILLGFCIYLGFLLKTTLSEMPVRLIPYGFETSKGVIETTKNGYMNNEYIQIVARADANLFSEFTPENAFRKSKQLVNRFEPSLYGASKADLLDQAQNNAEEQITQSYRIETVKSRDGSEALISGYLKRWEGAKLISEGFIHFAITYRYIDGIPYIYDYTPFERENAVIKELNEPSHKAVK